MLHMSGSMKPKSSSRAAGCIEHGEGVDKLTLELLERSLIGYELA